MFENVAIEEMDLTFTTADGDLKENGEDIELTSQNLPDYLDAVFDFYLGSGVEKQFNSFKEGFTKFLALVCFTRLHNS